MYGSLLQVSYHIIYISGFIKPSFCTKGWFVHSSKSASAVFKSLHQWKCRKKSSKDSLLLVLINSSFLSANCHLGIMAFMISSLGIGSNGSQRIPEAYTYALLSTARSSGNSGIRPLLAMFTWNTPFSLLAMALMMGTICSPLKLVSNRLDAG